MTKTEELLAKADAVAGWSNCNQAWLDCSEDTPAVVVGHINEDGETYPVTTIDCDQYYAAQDSMKLAKFYAAANPATIKQLVEGYRGAIESLRKYDNVMFTQNYAGEAIAAFERFERGES